MRLHIIIFMCVWAMFACAQSAYISKVWEYCPAPGQFVNTIPEYEEGDDAESIRQKAEEMLIDNNRGLLSLGAWGGYIVFSFDHPVQNVEGEYDFRIDGNSMYATGSDDAGSAEPGIVMVSYDANQNGLPDDEWYELAGSEYNNPTTQHNYQVTYYRPAADHTPTPDASKTYLTDTTHIAYKTSVGENGYIRQISFHKQTYYPQWINADSLIFSGARLSDNAIDVNGNGSYYQLRILPWGYADNKPNTCDDGSHCSEFNLDWAVDKDGNHVILPAAHFFKVYTAVLQQCGWIGETSTEISGAEDLHPAATAINETNINIHILNTFVSDNLTITSPMSEQVQVLDMTGHTLFSAKICSGTTVLPCQSLPKGIYMLKTTNKTYKFIKH